MFDDFDMFESCEEYYDDAAEFEYYNNLEPIEEEPAPNIPDQYLVQIKSDFGVFNNIYSANKLIDFVDSLDYNDVESYKLWKIEDEKIIPIMYTGWQPNCLIEFADENNNIVLRGYGEDH